MLWLVVGLNLGLTLMNCYVAWKIWHFRQTLENATQVMTQLEQSIYNIFYPAPVVIIKGQVGTRRFRQACATLGLKFKQLERLLNLLGVLPKVWRGTRGFYARRSRRDRRTTLNSRL